METPFKTIDIANDEVLTEDLMNAMHSNHQWLYENTPRGRFYYDESGGKSRTNRIQIISGRVYIPKNKKSAYDGKRVNFPGKMFAPLCRPNVTTGILSDNQEVYCVVNGIGQQPMPSAEGFEIRIFSEPQKGSKWKISKGFYVCWSAVGWKEEQS